ncbi:MAG: redoxin domain-containing protein [Planctomycetaceae bacterium]|nr:redoxin domain-containing protein [Planctomycetaceae bacterium]
MVPALAALAIAGCQQSAPPAPVATAATIPPPPPPVVQPAAVPAVPAAVVPAGGPGAVYEPAASLPVTAPVVAVAAPAETTAFQPTAPTEPAVALAAPPSEPASDQIATASPEAAGQEAAGQETAGQATAGQAAEHGGAGGDAGLKAADPFEKRFKAPDFPKGMQWMNTKPLSKADLKGKFVLLDFWTYCCINCMHVLPELKKLEKEFANQLVVIGVHSAKFETEKDADNIRAAILRYEIDHPVVNDADHRIWDTYGVNSWPTIVLIDPQGDIVAYRGGEFKAEEVRAVLSGAIPYYRGAKLLDEKPFALLPESASEEATPLRFPGKVLADEAGERLFITDSNHNRLVIASLDGKLIDIIGSGEIGRADGDYRTASFNHPQGCALAGDTLYVADTENHMLRKVNLATKTVTTISGTGEQAEHPWPGLDAVEPRRLPDRFVGLPGGMALNSPWALWVHKSDLYIAMAGPHQIWKMPLSEKEIGPYAGNGREDIVDGSLLPKRPYMQGFSSFAQPSGLTSDGTWLYVADSEGSSIRAVPFDPRGRVKTVVGSDHLDSGRLFAFGDQDGPRKDAKLQHCLEVVYLKGKIYVADTYNHKIKVVDAKNGETKTIAGTGKPGRGDDPAEFHEPAGLAHAKGKLYIADTNNHLLRTLDLATNKVATLTIAGLTTPGQAVGSAPRAATSGATGSAQPASSNVQPAATNTAPKKPSFKGAVQEKLQAQAVKPVDGKVKLAVSLKYPAGWKVNPDAPMSYWVDATKAGGPVDRTAMGRVKLPSPVAEFEATVPVTSHGDDEVTVSLNYYYCEKKAEGVCKVGSVVFTVPLMITTDGRAEPVKLVHTIPE